MLNSQEWMKYCLHIALQLVQKTIDEYVGRNIWFCPIWSTLNDTVRRNKLVIPQKNINQEWMTTVKRVPKQLSETNYGISLYKY